ncbi:MAG: MotA/TolQ/ExbB proton channel family protein [Gammaproteobacteria bacterium]
MLTQLYIDLRSYFEAGGVILWPIFAVTIVLWMAIIERWWYLFFIYPGRRDALIEEWNKRSDQTSWYARRIREKRLSELSIEVRSSIPLIKSLIAAIPLLGLLGTVTGMVTVFQALSSVGSTNAQAMAHGVSSAIIPTMSAMAVAVFSLYFVYALEKRIQDNSEEIEDGLRHF